MLFVNFLCLFYLMVLVASHTISKSNDRADLLDGSVDSLDDHHLQKHPRKVKDNNRHLFWWRKPTVSNEKPNESKSTARSTAKEVTNAYVTTVQQMPTDELVHKDKKAKETEKTKTPHPTDDDKQTESEKSNGTSSSKYVKSTTKPISTSPKKPKNKSKEKKTKKHKSKPGHSTEARGTSSSDEPHEKHRRDLAGTNLASSYLTTATAAGYHSAVPTLSNYYKMLAEMSTKLDKLKRLYSKSYGLDTNRAFTLPSLQELKQNSNRFTDSFQNRVSAPDKFEGTDTLESLLSEVKFRAIEMIAKQTPALTDLITNAVITTTFTADPMLIHYDTPHHKVMQMDLEGAAPTLAPSFKGMFKKPAKNTVKSLKKGQYNDDEASYFVVEPGGTRRDREVDDSPKNSGTTVDQIVKKVKHMFNKVKQSVTLKGDQIDNASERDDQKNEKSASRHVSSKKSKSVSLKVKLKEINPNKTTCLTKFMTNKVLVSTKLPTGKHRKGNVHSTKRHSSKHKKNKKKLTRNTSTTPMTVATEDEDYAALSLVEQVLSREVRANMSQLLSTAINPTIKRGYRRAVDDAETGSIANRSLGDIASNYDDPSTDTPIDETSYEGLTRKISYNDFVDGYRHYLNFEKDMGHSNFSNMVRYQAHRHHDVDDIGKFILDKLPRLPVTQERYKRDFFDDDDDDQDISTKSEESWFKKHFYYLADRSVPPKKFHSSQLVPLRLPQAGRDGTTRKPNTKFMTKKNKHETHRTESQSANGEKMDDLDELARMLRRGSSAFLTLDTANIPQNADDYVTAVRSSRLSAKMIFGTKRTAKKSKRKHTVIKRSKRPKKVKDARLKIIRRHEVNKKLKSKRSYVQTDEAESTKGTVATNLFDQAAADEQKTKEKRDRIETTNAITDRAIEEGKGKKKLGYVNVELVPATTSETLKKVKERGRLAKFVHNFRFRMKKPDKRQRRAVTRKEKCGLFRKLKEIFGSKPKTHKDEHFVKDYAIVTRKISAYNPIKYAKNLNEIKYEIPIISDDIRNSVYPDLTAAARTISSTHLADYWATEEPLTALATTGSRAQEMYEESGNNKDQRSNAEKIDQIRKEIENLEVKTSSPFDWSYDTVGRSLKDFEDVLQKGYLPNEMKKGNIQNNGVILTGQNKHTSPQSNKINDDAYTFVKKNSAANEHHAAPLDNSVSGIMNYIYKKSHTKEDLDDSSLKPQYTDKIANIPAETNFVKENDLINPKSTTNDDLNDLMIWNSDILHSDSVLKSTVPPVKEISIKDDYAELLKGNQLYAEHTFSKKVELANHNQKNRHNVSDSGKKTRAIKYKGRSVKHKWDFRKDLTYDNIAKRLDVLLSRASTTELYDRMSTENYDKVISYEMPKLSDILTDSTTVPYEEDIDFLRDGMKITKNALLPEVRSFTLYKKNKSTMTLPQQFHATLLPMNHKDFDDFLKLNDIDVESVTALENNGTMTIISPTQMMITEAPYNSGNSKSNKNDVDRSHQMSKEILRRIYGFEDGVLKSLKRKIIDQRKPSREVLPSNLLDDYDDQSELPQSSPESAFSYHGKNEEAAEPDSKPDDAFDLPQEHIRDQNDANKDKFTMLNKFKYGRKHNKFFSKDEEVPTQPVLEPMKLKSRTAHPPKRIMMKGHSYKYDIVYRDGNDPGGMLTDRDRPASTNALAETEDLLQDGREQVYDQLNIPTMNELDQERRKGKMNIAGYFGSRTTDNGRVSVKDSYNFLDSILRKHTLGATASGAHARPASTLDFHNYFDVGVKFAQEFKDKMQRKRKEMRKDKREAGEETYTAKNVAEIEVIVDLIKNPEAFEELSRGTHTQNTSKAVVNKEVKPVNSIQVHIGVPRYGTECHSAKRSLQNIKKVFIAKLCSPVDLEYQVKSYVIPTSTTIPTGVYLLLDNNDNSDGNLVLKPIFHNINVAVVKPREISSVLMDYSTEKITTTQTVTKLNKVTLTRDFVEAVNKHLMQLCELLSINETHHVHARAANEEKPRRSLSWKRLKKYFRGEHVCDCNCRTNATMCKSCAASDKVMTDLIFEIDSLINFMNDHCTEIQTFFFKNPSGGKKLKDSVKMLDRSLQDYYKRVKGKCKGTSCDGFRFLDKRFFYSTPKYKYTDLLNYFPYGINSPITEETTLTEYSRNDFFDKHINIIDVPDQYETTETKKKNQIKPVYSLDNVNVNIICKDNNVTTTKFTPKRFNIGVHVSNTPYTEPILVRVENKLKKDSRHSNKYKKREVGQIDSPLNADSSGSFWNDYFNKINESAMIFVATGMIPDTATINNEINVNTAENINVPIEKASQLNTLYGTNQYDNTAGNRLQTRSATLSFESIINTEAPSTDAPLQQDLTELMKLLEDVYVKDFNDITMNINTITKKPVGTTKITLFKNCTCRKDIKEKGKCKCAEKETADTYTATDGTTTDEDTHMFKFLPNISETATEDWRSSTREFKNLFPYLKKLKDATLGWFNYDKSKEGIDTDKLTPVTPEKDQLFRVMEVLGIKNKKEAYTTTVENPTILILNDDEEPGRNYSKDSHTSDVDNSSGIPVLDIPSKVDAPNNLLLSLLKYESQKLAKEWKRYAGRINNAKSSVDDEPKKKELEDNVMRVSIEAINKTEDSIPDRESSRCDNATGEKNKEQDKQFEEVKKEIWNEKNIENEIQREIEIKKEEEQEKEIENEIQLEKQLIKSKEKEIEKEKQKKERCKEKLRKLKEKGTKMMQGEKDKESKINPKEKHTQKLEENGEKQISNEKSKEEKIKDNKKEGNQMPKSMDENQSGATEKTLKINDLSKGVSILAPLRKLEFPAAMPGKEGFINRILNKFNVSWCTTTLTTKQEATKPIESWRLTEATEGIPMGLNDYYDSDAIMSVSLITGDKGEIATERRSIVEPMDPQKTDDGSDQPRRLCDLQDTFSYALRCLQQDKKLFQDYAKRIPCHKYMNTPKWFCIEPEKRDRGKMTVLKEPESKLRWDWQRNKRSLYIEEVEDPLKVDRATDDELLDGNSHSLRDALMSNDGFERMYKDEFGIYRIETRKKRSSVDAEAVIRGLKDLAPIKVPKNEIYAMPRDSVTITCALDASKGPISWSLNEGPIPDNAVVKGTRLAIQSVKTENSGNYTCFQCFRSGSLSADRRERWTQLTVVRLPVFRIVTFLLYRCRPLCTANTNHSSLASVFVDVAPARRAARCGVECARNMYCSLTRLIADNAATIATVPVIVSWKVRNTTLTPLVRQKILVMPTSNIRESNPSNPLRAHPKWTSGELDVKMNCPAGYYLVPEMKLCVTNPVRFLPAIPRRVRRYDWWRPSYLCLSACVVVGALCACGANALTRGEGAAEGGRGNRVAPLPCAEAPGRRRISPSRVILPRLFRHASSRISQETKLDLRKKRLPPPLPPIDFDP